MALVASFPLALHTTEDWKRKRKETKVKVNENENEVMRKINGVPLQSLQTVSSGYSVWVAHLSQKGWPESLSTEFAGTTEPSWSFPKNSL